MNKKIKIFLKNNWQWFVIGASLGLFVILTILVLTGATESLDWKITNWFVDRRTESKTLIYKLITVFACEIYIVCMCLLILVLCKDRSLAIKMVCCVFISAILNWILKDCFRRERPHIIKIVSDAGFSFPSGHAMTGCTFYGVLTYTLWKSKNFKKPVKIILTPLFCVTSIAVGVSRIYLGAHFFTDVVAGFLISIAYQFFYRYMMKRFFPTEEEKEKQKMQEQKQKEIGLFVLQFPTAEQREFMDKYYSEQYGDLEKDESIKIEDDSEKIKTEIDSNDTSKFEKGIDLKIENKNSNEENKIKK